MAMTDEQISAILKNMRAAGAPPEDMLRFKRLVDRERMDAPSSSKWTDEDVRRAIGRAPNTSDAEKRAKLRALEHGRSYVPVGKAAEDMGAGVVDSMIGGATWGGWDEAGGAITSKMRNPKYGTVSPEAATDVMRNQMDEYAHNHPYRDLAGKIGGNIGAMVGGAGVGRAAAPGAAKTMGRILGSSLGRRTAAGGAIGAADAALYGFGEGEGGVENRLGSAARSAPFGAAGGFLAPPAAYLGGKYIGRPIAEFFEGRKTDKASRALGRMLSEADLAESRAAPTDAPLFAKSQSGMYAARALHGTSPEGSRTITKAAEAYREGTGERAMKKIADALGKRTSVRQALREFRKTRSAKAKPLYEAAEASARPVNTNRVVDVLKDELTPGASEVFGPRAGPPLDTLDGALKWINAQLHNKNGSQVVDYKHLHRLQRQIRERFLGKTNDRAMKRVIGPIRKKLLEALDTATTGMDGKSLYARARKAYAGDMEVEEAYLLGKDILRKGRSGVDIEDLLEDLGSMSASERDALAKGMANAIGVKAEDATAGAVTRMFKRADSAASRKLRAVYGDVKGEKLRKALDWEEKTHDYAGRAIYGSDTAQTRAAQEALGIKPPSGGSVTSGELATGATALTGDPSYAIGSGVVNLTKRGLRANRSAKDREMLGRIAKMLSATGNDQLRNIDEIMSAGSRMKNAGDKAEARARAIARLLRNAPAANELGQWSLGGR